MIDSNNKNTVIFDFGDTLASTVPTFPMRIGIALRNLGFDFTDNDFLGAYHLADYRIYQGYKSSGSISYRIYQNTLFDVLRASLNIEMDREELKKLEAILTDIHLKNAGSSVSVNILIQSSIQPRSAW